MDYGHHSKPATSNPTYPQWDIDNCTTILGWLFNSMEDMIYHIFIYNDNVNSLWTALSQMYAHAHHDFWIFELYLEIVRASQDTLGLSIADYFSFLQSRWEELTQYEHLSDFFAAAATIASPAISSWPPLIAGQMAFAASYGSDSRFSGGRPICSYYGNIGYIRELCFKLHPKLRKQFSKCKGKGHHHTATVADTSLGHTPDLSHIQSLIGQLQSQLCSLLQHHPSSSIATLATGTPSFSGSEAATIPANLDGLPRPILLFESPQVQVPPTSDARAPLKVYTRRAPP
ncbi:hypothetical protein Acr_21g0002890 [Actinidia rufa]|uniref:Uncharacterized protein n=1 Tax=Actinidia rufa TaxID=165716 RepID=A0A7J0GFU2_9ERIC|nr:hypothetical protein Acr_21g0002890 [Actinidia rufa]